MGEKCYFISEASKLIGVEAHVLRYWEEQLELSIRRNEMGHRYYIEEDIRLMQSIKQIMEKGIQLRAVKMMLPGLMQHREDTLLDLVGGTAEQDAEGSKEMREVGMPETVQEMTGTAEQKSELLPGSAAVAEQTRQMRMAQFQEILSSLIGQALKDNNPELAATTSGQVTERVIKEMDYLMRVRESQEEERYKKLDEAIRSLQKSRTERHFRLGKRGKAEKQNDRT